MLLASGNVLCSTGGSDMPSDVKCEALSVKLVGGDYFICVLHRWSEFDPWWRFWMKVGRSCLRTYRGSGGCWHDAETGREVSPDIALDVLIPASRLYDWKQQELKMGGCVSE